MNWGIELLQSSALPLGYVAVWSGRRDSNSRPSPWQGDTLPLSHSRASLRLGCALFPPTGYAFWRKRRSSKPSLLFPSRTRFAGLRLGKSQGFKNKELKGQKTARGGAFVWCLRSESNQRHADFQSAALPTELRRHMVGASDPEIQYMYRVSKMPLMWRPRTGSNRRPPA